MNLLRKLQLALRSKAQKASPSPPAEGGEGWGEEGHSSCSWPVRMPLDTPPHEPAFAEALATIPPLPFKRGEGPGEGSVPSLGFRAAIRARRGGRSLPTPLPAHSSRAE